jgi:hypothetical protein
MINLRVRQVRHDFAVIILAEEWPFSEAMKIADNVDEILIHCLLI